ncbi:Mu transposase C-terminal domain-containing protein [Acinetobacter sp. ACZLY 512]|uniref:Mu transposase C-terminal domain-containing protein n=1 Tax=Acinetobacter sp. ACZLY 512 TaxID=2911206 RepID=UPI00202761F6|nr:Mu transposase C-terminal domain-containing protein [Acinetobacter sp. ACZLY 512]MCL9677217.1 Mu transposase C-terminal domain-containing protein [Acinetobacter sp. ACZLY 512]
MLRLIPGSHVNWKEESYIIIDLIDLQKAVLKHIHNKGLLVAPLSELKHGQDDQRYSRVNLPLISDEDWQQAWQRYQLILPLLEKGTANRTIEDVKYVARKAGKNHVTIYRWLKNYEDSGRVSSLLRKGRSDVDSKRLAPETEAIIDEVIQEFHLTKQRYSTSESCLEVMRRCKERNVKQPHPNSVRNRIQSLSEKELISKRFSPKAARERFKPIEGSFPNADFPLAVVQIDHTPVDLIIVDDNDRLPIGRPFLTIALDCCSRMITGFYLTLEAPGALSAGLCISHSIMTKEMWLAKFDISTTWPVWGIMRKIYVDNAKEFRGAMLDRACKEYGIILEHRPRGLPNYGGHVERAFRTFMTKTHNIAGTTFSNTVKKGDYDSEATATMTFDEFERWFTIFIVQVYHQKGHKGISDIPPIKLYEQAILGTENSPGIGLPAPIEDELKLRLDFMPYIERTIQEYGVLIDNIHYYSDVLRMWIHARDEKNIKLKQKFIFARDPRDISVVYFLDPHTKQYYPIPYRDASRPSMSLWELRAVLKRLGEDDLIQPNEDIIFDGLQKMREIENEALQRTRSSKNARRSQQRRKHWKNKDTHLVETQVAIDSVIISSDEYPESYIEPYADIKE